MPITHHRAALNHGGLSNNCDPGSRLLPPRAGATLKDAVCPQEMLGAASCAERGPLEGKGDGGAEGRRRENKNPIKPSIRAE